MVLTRWRLATKLWFWCSACEWTQRAAWTAAMPPNCRQQSQRIFGWMQMNGDEWGWIKMNETNFRLFHMSLHLPGPLSTPAPHPQRPQRPQGRCQWCRHSASCRGRERGSCASITPTATVAMVRPGGEKRSDLKWSKHAMSIKELSTYKTEIWMNMWTRKTAVDN